MTAHGSFVQGSDDDPYEVEITLRPHKKFTMLESGSTCPYGSQCKHAAAVALYALSKELRVEEYDEDEEEAPDAEPRLNLRQAPPMSLELPVPPELREWLEEVGQATVDPDGFDPNLKHRVFYRLQNRVAKSGPELPSITPITQHFLKTGQLGGANDVSPSIIESSQKPKCWTRRDHVLVADLHRNAGKVDWNRAEYRLEGKHGARLLRDIIETGRCVWINSRIVSIGEPRTGRFEWEAARNEGSLVPRIKLPGDAVVLAVTPPWYLDPFTMECGPVDCGLAEPLAAALIRTGPTPIEHLALVRSQFEALGLPPELLPDAALEVVVRAPEPTPCFSVDFEVCEVTAGWPMRPFSAPVAFGKLTFEYEGIKPPAEGGDIRIVTDQQLLVLRRNPVAEKYALDFLISCGWRNDGFANTKAPKGRNGSLSIVPSDPQRPIEPVETVAKFAKSIAPKLVSDGWKFSFDENFRFVPDSAIEWDVSLESESGIDWFEFQLGIRVEGEPFHLKSVLARLFVEKQLGAVRARANREANDDFFVFGLNGRAIKLSRRRLEALLQPLVELFGGVHEWPEELRLPKTMLPDLGVPGGDAPWRTSEELTRLSEKFAAFDRLEPLSEPEGFVGQLRGYQREGLAWLQFLREYGFGGILADDMGLGKTVQVLAHIQAEKASGRMDRPCLIVAPTSTMPNWRRECERFAPGLRVVTLQGAGRSGRFDGLNDVDIALTTYPLLARDQAQLSKSSYHVLVLDEAQNVKNPTTAAAKAARELNARHRLCLSGTPVENHLGELWSLFHLLMPGFLGTDADFKKRFRWPIEKQGDASARERLARRIRPFMLRRTKGQVVRELPAKTEVIETIEFDDPQRDLYESIRSAMDKQVRELLAAQGFDRSRIQILDAQLKLRQVCCDPRLVKLPSAKTVETSAKLDRLSEMLGVLLEDGRRVLLFSQFTSMLDLIERRLRIDGHRWVRISGDTVDRETPVRQFQAGEAPGEGYRDQPR